MRRVLAVLVVLAASVTTVGASSTAVAAGGDQPPVKLATRQYGDRAVFVLRDQVLLLRFRGEKGDRVSLNVAFKTDTGLSYSPYPAREIELLDANRRPTGVHHDRLGFYHLPRSGWFMLRYHAADTAGAAGLVQLFVQDRIRYHAGDHVTLPKRRGHMYVVRLRAPKDRFDLVSFGTHMWRVQSRDKMAFSSATEILVGGGYPAVDGVRPSPLSLPLETGEAILVQLDPNKPGFVESHPAKAVAVEIDGPALPPGGARTAVAATFAGVTGQLVHPEPSGRAAPTMRLFGPAHHMLLPGLGSIFKLPATGTFTAVYIPVGGVPAAQGLRVRSLVDGGDVTVDGASLVVPAQPDGRLVVAHLVYPSGTTAAYMSATADTLSSPDWRAEAGVFQLRCGPRGPLGCGDFAYMLVTRADPVGGTFFYGDTVVVDTAASATGSLTLAFTSTAPAARVASAPAARGDSPPVKHATRQYGGRPVFVARDQLLLLRFDGERGDRVRLNSVQSVDGQRTYAAVSSGQVDLVDPSKRGAAVARDPSGFFRLPRTGRFTFRYQQGDYASAAGKVQLFVQDRVRYHAGETLELPAQRGHQYVVRVRAPQEGFDLVWFGVDHWGLQVDDRFSYGGVGPAVLVGAGYPVVDGETRLHRSEPLAPGESVLVLLDPSETASVESHRAEPVALTVDGAAAPPAGARTTVAAAFTGQGGQFVQIEDRGDDFHNIALFGPGHRLVAPGRLHPDVFRLPASGTSVAVPVPVGDVPAANGLRVRNLLDAGSVVVDGAPLVVAGQPDGRLVLAHIPGGTTSNLYLAATDDTLANPAWSATAGLFSIRCPARGPLGCGDFTFERVTRSDPISGLFSGDLAVVDTGASATGSVSLHFSSTPPT